MYQIDNDIVRLLKFE